MAVRKHPSSIFLTAYNNYLWSLEGNLGTRGMALFFYTHECNPICASLNLTPFDLSPMEYEHQVQQHLLSPTYTPSSAASTACRGSEEPLSPFTKLSSFFRRKRCQSSDGGSDAYFSKTSSSPPLFSPHPEYSSTTSYEENSPLGSSITKNMFTLPPVSSFVFDSVRHQMIECFMKRIYSRSQSVSVKHCHKDLSKMWTFYPSKESSSQFEEVNEVQNSYNHKYDYRRSSVAVEKAIIEELDEKHDSILGQVFGWFVWY